MGIDFGKTTLKTLCLSQLLTRGNWLFFYYQAIRITAQMCLASNIKHLCSKIRCQKMKEEQVSPLSTLHAKGLVTSTFDVLKG